MEKTADLVIDSFYGSISPEKFRTLYRIPRELPAAVMVEQLKLAIVDVRGSLRRWRSKQSAETLDAVSAAAVDGTPEKRLLFERAVFSLAKAEILRETVTVDRRPDAENAAKSGSESEEKYREFAADAISRIVEEPIITVETI